MSDETIYQHGDTRIDVGTLTGDLRVFDKGDLMAIVDDGGYVQEAIEHLRAEVERLEKALNGAVKKLIRYELAKVARVHRDASITRGER